MLDSKAILELSVTVKRYHHIIYFLIHNNEIVYVGKTADGLKRVFNHTDKEWDSYAVIECSTADETTALEGVYIGRLAPKYNLSMSSCYSMEKAKKATKRNVWDIKRAIRELGITPMVFNGSPYITPDEMEAVRVALKGA
jgi:predicted GIY-YIG superfamily endonuclease